MIKNYLRSALRNIKRHPFISFINIFGLTVGLTCCLLILAYIINERSYDKFNSKANDIYRVTRIFYTAPGVENLHLSSVAPPFGPLLQNAFPDIQKVTRVLPNSNAVLKYNEKLFNEKGSAFADENFFTFFDIPIVKGDKKNGLYNPYNIMLSEEAAKKYFGDEDPINKGINVNFYGITHDFKVTGVYKAFPANSHMHPEILMSFNTLKDTAVYGEKQLQTNFGNNSFYTYLLFPKDYNVARVSAQLPDFLDKYVHLNGMPGNLKTHQVTSLTLQKLTDIHLRSHLDDEYEENGDINRVYIFSAIALFILLIACINYMNLSTARSALRAKEIGIRKVIGAQRKEIIFQFLSESVLITFLALVLAAGITAVSIPMVNNMASQHLSVQSLLQWSVLVPILLLPFVIGMISGIYPAIFISSFLPVRVLKGIVKAGQGGLSFRKVLVVLQFSISIILIVATTVVFQQLQYIQTKALGFNKDHIVTMDYVNKLNPQFESFKDELTKTPFVKEIGRSSRIPSGRLLDDQNAKLITGGSPQAIKIDLKYITTDYGFIPTFGMQMASGRNFSKEFSTDTNNFIINEEAVKQFGWNNENALGRDLQYGNVTGKIIGVVKDFHFESLHQKIIPLLFSLPSIKNSFFNKLSIKIDGRDPRAGIQAIQDTWHKYLPETPFEYSFLDDKFGQLYNSEQQQGSLFTIFSCIAIFIACLGLFGLSAFTITQRIKEIGVRKVLGASVPQIVRELSKDFLLLVVISAFIALPVAYWAMKTWFLGGFAFHINISWWVLLLAGVLALIIAFVTISFQSIKAALMNPVKSLRSE